MQAKQTQYLMTSSIGRKFAFAVLFGVMITSLLGLSITTWRELEYFNTAKSKEIQATAYVIATSLSQALNTRDMPHVYGDLRAISRLPDFIYARVTDNNGHLVAELGSAVVVRSKSYLPIVFRDRIQVVTDVIHGGKPIGHLTLVATTGDVKRQITGNFLSGISTTIIAAVIGLLISFFLQKRISTPLQHLTEAMNRIRETQDFSHPVPRESDDETGMLVEAFNDMQQNIRERDAVLTNYMETLEQTVDNRTRELVEARDVAEMAAAAKSDFLATMSHEIRTPMNGMLVMAELLASGQLTEQNRRYADVIVKSGQMLLTIINDVLDFSKIESGKLQLEHIELDPSQLADDVISLFFEQAVGKGLDIAAYVAPDVPPRVIGDPVRLTQILTNLVSNALKFTQKGSVSIEVRSVRSRIKNHVQLEFSVVDTGIGIPEEKTANIFDAFSQADQSTTRNFGGTGLGLAICRKLVNAMNGEIDVTSTIGSGSRFRFHMEAEVALGRRAKSLPEINRLRHAVYVPSGPVTDDALVRYLSIHGIKTTPLIDAKRVAREIDNCELLIGPPVALAQFTEAGLIDRNRKLPYIVCLTAIGDTDFQGLAKANLIDEILPRPIARRDITSLLKRLEEDSPRREHLLDQNTSGVIDLPDFTGAHVLVADDSPVNQEVAIEALKRLGVTCDTVGNGQRAIEAVKSKHYDAILMDCSMPVMDGSTAAQLIREWENEDGIPHHPIIAVTAHITGTSSLNWQTAGMDDFITKPFRIGDLSDILGAYLAINKSHIQKDKRKKEQSSADEARDLSLETESDLLELEDEQSHTNNNPLPIIDESVMASYGEYQDDGGIALMKRLFDLFLEHAPEALEALRNALENKAGDPEVATTAHALKSMSRNIGAARLAKVCETLEFAAKGGGQRDDKALFAAILAEFENTHTYILDRVVLASLEITASASSSAALIRSAARA